MTHSKVRFPLHVLAALSALVALVSAHDAHAQTTGGGNISITSSGSGVTRTLSRHTPTTFEYVISKADCQSQDAFQFPYSATNFAGLNLEVWLADIDGVSCDQGLARDPTSTASHCKQLFSTPADMGGVITIATSKIASSVSTVTAGCVDTNGNSLPRTLRIYFMLVASSTGNIDASNFTVWDKAQLDMLGPPAPTSVSASPADTAVSVTYAVSNVKDVAGYYVYCDPPAAGAPATAASSTGAGATTSTTAASTSVSTGAAGGATSSSTSAGGATASTGTLYPTSSATAGAGGASSGSCTSSVLVPGQIPPQGYVCGKATGAQVTAMGLTDGVNYAVGVAAFDNVNNVGPLSALSCTTPVKVDDFFSNYRNAGGQAGNCACSVAGQGGSLGAVLFGALALTAAAARRRPRGRR